jgi:predicted nucleic acid-binding protein
MYLLDTNVISELRKPTGKANPRVISWAKRVDSSDLYLSAISIFELEKGILQRERKDIRQGNILRQWFDQQYCLVFQAEYCQSIRLLQSFLQNYIFLILNLKEML